MILVFILYFICATMFTISKWALGHVQPIFFVGSRMTIAGILLLSYAFFGQYRLSARQLLKGIKADWWLFVQLIIFHVYLAYICDVCALVHMSSIESAFLYNLSPFVAAFCSFLWFNEKMTFKKWVGLIIGFLSLIPLLFIKNEHVYSFSGFVPYIVTIIAVISSAYGWIIVRQLVKSERYSTIFVNGFSMFVGGLLAFITSWYTEIWHPFPVINLISFVKSTMLIVVMANIIFYNLYGYLLKYYTATFLSFAGFSCPLFAAFLGWFFLAESFSIYYIFSLGAVAIGLYIFYQEELKQGYIERR